MKEEFSASTCCSWEAVRMTAEKGVDGADGVGLDASKADLRGPRGADGNRSRLRRAAGTGFT